MKKKITPIALKDMTQNHLDELYYILDIQAKVISGLEQKVTRLNFQLAKSKPNLKRDCKIIIMKRQESWKKVKI